MSIICGNADEDFDRSIEVRLGRYVYALRDPRDRKVFYIGKAGGNSGQGNNRVFHHFREARLALRSPSFDHSSKVLRIIDIWKANEAVEWFIVRHGLGDSDAAAIMHVEGALIDLLEISQNGPALNIQSGHHVASCGLLRPEDIRALAAQPVVPITAHLLKRPVFIFPVQNAIGQDNAYQATRGNWKVAPRFRNLNSALAVGIARGLSVGVFSINSWHQVDDRWQFDGIAVDELELHLRSYLNIIGRAMGYYMRGNYLVVEFLENNQFKFLRGSPDRTPQDL